MSDTSDTERVGPIPMSGGRQSPGLASRVDYLATLDRIPEALHAAIRGNAAQLCAWRELFGFEELLEATPEFLRKHPYLVLDTRHFEASFRQQLAATIDELHTAVDGVLVQGDNLPALHELAPRFAGSVRCCYIDPPYNTGSTAWTYQDRFDRDAWAAMMRQRLEAARAWLAEDGAIFVSIDDREQASLRLLMDEVFGPENFLATIVWEKVHTRKNSAKHFSVSHEYIIAFARTKDRWRRQLLPRDGTAAYANPDSDPRGPWKPDPVYANKPYAARYQIVKPNGVKLAPPPGRYWRLSEESFLAKAAADAVIWGDSEAYPMIKRYLADVQDGLVPVTLFTRAFAGDNALANAELRAMFGAGRPATYPKPTRLIERLLQISSEPEGRPVVLDFFAGTGATAQAVLNRNRADNGRRRYVLMEQSDVFDLVLVPRVMKSIYATQWRDSRPLSRDGVSQLVEVVRLVTD